MEQAGYEIQKNPRSVTFKKDGIRIRDSRLGYPYTREGILYALENETGTGSAKGLRTKYRG